MKNRHGGAGCHVPHQHWRCQVSLHLTFATRMQLASFFYRNFDGDSPLSRLSGHARECSEMAALFQLGQLRSGAPAAAWRHFVCIDEYGKGTEDTHATALCCAALQRLDQVRPSLCPFIAAVQQLLARRSLPFQPDSRSWQALGAVDLRWQCWQMPSRSLCAVQGNFTGIFATHQHSLFDVRLGLLPLLQHCRSHRMLASSVTDASGSRECLEPLFRVAEGVSCESMAFQVAQQQVRR